MRLLILLLLPTLALAGDPELMADQKPTKWRTTDSITLCYTASWMRDYIKLIQADDIAGAAHMVKNGHCVIILPMEELTMFGMTKRDVYYKMSYQGRNVYMPIPILKFFEIVE